MKDDNRLILPFWDWHQVMLWEALECVGNDIFLTRVIENGGIMLFHKLIPAKNATTVEIGKYHIFTISVFEEFSKNYHGAEFFEEHYIEECPFSILR